MIPKEPRELLAFHGLSGYDQDGMSWNIFVQQFERGLVRASDRLLHAAGLRPEARPVVPRLRVEHLYSPEYVASVLYRCSVVRKNDCWPHAPKLCFITWHVCLCAPFWLKSLAISPTADSVP